jgi:hypothetical protein
MHLPSRRFKREIIALALVAGAALTYLSLLGSRWAVYVTLCVAYTIVIVGMAWANGNWKLYFGGGKISLQSFAKAHFSFLLAAVLFMWAAILLRPSMPDWLVSQGDSNWSWYYILVIALLVGLVLLEQWWIEKRPRRDAD